MSDLLPIAIVGAGALGRTYAAALAQSGVPVVLVARRETGTRLLAAGEIRTGGMLKLAVPTTTTARPGAVTVLLGTDLPKVRGIIFATKGYDLTPAAESFASASPDWVIGVQNGVAKDEILKELYGPRVMGAAGNLAGERSDDGSILISNLGVTYVGETDGSTSARSADLVAALVNAGIPARVPPDVRSVEWSKVVIVSGGFGVDFLARSVWSESMENPHFTRASLSLARETASIARAEGVSIADYPGLPALTYVTQPVEQSIALRAERVRKLRSEGGELDRKSSVLQDLLAGRPLEAEFVFDDLVRRARNHDVPAPRLEFVRDIARGINGRIGARGGTA